jgi:glycine cleavage system H protein
MQAELAMSDIPSGYRFKSSHEWARKESSGRITIGISDHAQSALGDLVYVDLPAVGRSLSAGEACAVVESVKAASDVYAPIAGTVVEVNQALADKPETVNSAPYGDGWMFVVEPADQGFDALLDAAAYGAQLAADGN